MTNQTERVHSHAGPSLLALAIVHTPLVVGSIVFGMLLKHGATVVNPYSVAEEARRFFADNPVVVRVSTFFLFGSSVPLGIYAATVISRLRFLGVRAAGSYIALFGGFVASIALAPSPISGAASPKKVQTPLQKRIKCTARCGRKNVQGHYWCCCPNTNVPARRLKNV